MRIRCVVPFCKRTRGDRKGEPLRPGMEWICGDHWKSIPKKYRRVHGRLARRWRRFGNESDGIAGSRIWRRLKKLATERAVGL